MLEWVDLVSVLNACCGIFRKCICLVRLKVVDAVDRMAWSDLFYVDD